MKINKELLVVYKQLQYDIMFGEQYGYSSFKNKIKNQHFLLGSGPMTIEQVSVETAGEQAVLKVAGSDLPYNSIVRMNGQSIATKWISKNELEAVVSSDLTSKQPWKIEVIVKDSKDRLIAKSNAFKKYYSS